jgi:NAD(P)H-dependent flavin oxidoreductase YrpB (nitropropane dioxygenase family)
MIRTRLCDLLGIEFPIISAPMGFVSGPELAAAVSNAGGLGTMSFSANPPHILRRDIERLRSLTSRPLRSHVSKPACRAHLKSRLRPIHFLSPVVQFTTSVMGADGASSTSVLTRMRLPSDETS